MWGGSLPATKLALNSFGPFTLAAARLLLASALFVVVLRPTALRRLPKHDALKMASLGMIGFAGVQVLQALGTSRTSAATATVLASTSPLWIALLAPVFLREPVRPWPVLGVLIALLGVAAITGLDEPGALAGSLPGNVVVMLSSVAAAIYTVMGKGLARRYSPILFCGVSCLGGALASLPLAWWELSSSAVNPTSLGWALLAYLGILVTFVGFIIWFWGLRALPAAQAGALMFLQPLSGLILAVLILGDRPTPSFLVGCGLVLAGVYLAAGGRRWRRAPHVVLVTLLLMGCTGGPPPAEPPLASGVSRPTPSGPTPSLPVARPAAPSPAPAEAGGGAPLASQQTLRLQSSAFAIGGTIPADYTCDGADLSPPLSWSGVPIRTMAFTLLEQDVDTPRSTEPFTQWLLYNIPSRVTALDAGIPARLVLSNGAQQGQNDHQTIGYFGPCPNRGDPPHHYSFELIAQDAYVTLETGANIDAVRQALAGHSLGEAQLVATVQR